jgi:hypothetical protein
MFHLEVDSTELVRLYSAIAEVWSMSNEAGHQFYTKNILSCNEARIRNVSFLRRPSPENGQKRNFFRDYITKLVSRGVLNDDLVFCCIQCVAFKSFHAAIVMSSRAATKKAAKRNSVAFG